MNTLKNSIVSILTALCFAASALPPEPAMTVLESRFAGSWYSADPKELSSSIDAWMAASKVQLKGRPLALIMPHAGYAYSGPAAAFGAAAAKESGATRVIVLGPSHRAPLANSFCVPEAGAVSTPLGATPIDVEAVAKLRAKSFALANNEILRGEHSVQMEYPLLQRALGPGNFKIVPLVVGRLDEAHRKELADALLGICDAKTLLVVSSDFTHYGPSYGYVPFSKDVRENLEKLDMGAFERIKSLDPDALFGYVKRTGDTICGECPIGVLLRMLPKDASCELLRYDSSGAKTGDYSNSVSYMAIAFLGAKWPRVEKKYENASPETEALLDAKDRRALLKIARKSLEYGVMSGRSLPADACGVAISPAMKKRMGAFVTLKIDGDLRGCVGEIFPTRPLCDAVAERAVDAALRDSRFPRLRPADLGKVEIEISALTPPRKLGSYKEIKLGRDGVVLNVDGSGAVFLPQVAPEQGWSLEEMLTHLCIKANVPQRAWGDADAKFSVFEAVVFNEGQFPKD